MGMHRRSLRVLEPCDVFGPQQRESFCAQCRTNVHDLSRMTEAEPLAFVRSRSGTPVCIAYRYDSQGRVSFRPTPRRVGGVALALLLAACTGHMGDDELHLPGDVCFDAQGREVTCADSTVGYEWQPDVASNDGPRSKVPAAQPMDSVADARGPVTSCPAPWAAEVVEPTVVVLGSPDAEGGVHLRVDFEIDPERSRRLMGIFVGVEDSVDRDGPYGMLRFRPTRELWAKLAERVRARRTFRRARRDRR